MTQFDRLFTLRIALLSMFMLTMAAPRGHADVDAKGVRQAVEKGLNYLRRTQKKDGSWSEYPAITAVAVSAFLQNGKTEQNEPAVARGVKFLVGYAKPSGAICMVGKPAVTLPNYNTSLCVLALLQTNNPAYKPIIQKAQSYLEQSQFAEGQGIKPTNPMYGGIGYGDDPGDELHPDLSNLQHAIEALHACGVPPAAPVFRKALVYLQRVQNRRESNDQDWVEQGPNDGGFLYESQGGTKTVSGKHESYGAMTYAGLKCLKYCGVGKSDPKVKAAWSWISANYSVTEHPRMGSTSLYYYYRAMAMALDAYGQRSIVDKSARPHYWAWELATQIVSRQHPNGSWYSANARYWENRPDLITPYGLIILAYCRKNGVDAAAQSQEGMYSDARIARSTSIPKK